MATIEIRDGGGRNLASQFAPIYNVLKQEKVCNETIFDLTSTPFVRPLTILPLAALMHETQCGHLPPTNLSVRSYLSTLGFPHGLSSIPDQQEYSYIPIVKLGSDNPQGAEHLTSAFERLILGQLGKLPQGGRDAISYPIAEITTNLLEHSKKDVGWMMGQYYPKYGYLDVCILDCGRGFRTCYKEELGLDLSDEQAIQQVMKGKSCKKSGERGFGVWTTKRMVAEGLGGQCFILSGSSGYFASASTEVNFNLDGNVSWDGVIVAFRIPDIKGPIDTSKYYE